MAKRTDRRSGLVYSTGPRPIDPEEERGRAEQGAPAGPPAAALFMERKGRGGKTVTIVELRNLPHDEIQPIAKALKTACGVGGTVKGNVVELQGDQRERLRPVLEKQGLRVKG